MATLGAVPAFLVFALAGSPDALLGVPIVAAVAFLLFALERRDVASWWGTFGRVALAAILAVVIVPPAAMWVSRLGNPDAAMRDIERYARDLVRSLPFWVPVVAILANIGGLLFHVRRVTRETGPQLLAGLAVGGGAGLLMLVDGSRLLPISVGLVVSGLLVPLLAAQGDHLAAARDPRCPEPVEQPVGRVFAAWLPAGALGLCLVGALVDGAFGHRHHRGGESSAIGSLKTLNTAQTLYREGDKDGDGVLDYAGSLVELSETTLIDGVLGGGVKYGYVFRLVRSAPTSEFLWSGAADPVAPGATGDRYFVTNHAGVIYYTTSGPFPLDPIGCSIPANARPVGK